MEMPELHAYLALSASLKIGSVRLKRLLAFFGTAEKAWAAPEEKLALALQEPVIAQELIQFRTTFHLEKLLTLLTQEHIRVCTFQEKEYPALLRQIPHPPFLLYYKGSLQSLQQGLALAIVGTRMATPYGMQVAESIAREAVQAGMTVVSGGALGIDHAAHVGALGAEGNTIAVLAGGIDEANWFPPSHTRLFRQIIGQGGAVLSEIPPGVRAQQFSFPQRNRIIAGLSGGTVVVEAPVESGALITANFALEYNREVFAVPGSMYSEASKGTHALIQQGAQLITGMHEILETFHLTRHSTPSLRAPIALNPEETTIIALLSPTPLHVDALVAKSSLATPVVSATLTTLELKGLAKNLGGMQYIRI